MNKSQEIGKLATALSKAQLEIVSAKKDKFNPFFKSNYADLSSIIYASRCIGNHGLCISQTVEFRDNSHYLISILMHSSGEWISSEIKLKPAKDDMQALGAAITYARRFGISSLLSIPEEDDDGEGTTERDKDINNNKTIEPKTTSFKIGTVQENEIKILCDRSGSDFSKIDSVCSQLYKKDFHFISKEEYENLSKRLMEKIQKNAQKQIEMENVK